MEIRKGNEKEYVHCNSENYTRIRPCFDSWIQVKKCNRHTGEDVLMYFSIDEITFIQKTMSSLLKKRQEH